MALMYILVFVGNTYIGMVQEMPDIRTCNRAHIQLMETRPEVAAVRCVQAYRT